MSEHLKIDPDADIVARLESEPLTIHLAGAAAEEIRRLRAAQSPVDIEDVEVLCETAVGAVIGLQRGGRLRNRVIFGTPLDKIMNALLEMAQEMRTKIREHK